MFEPLEVVTKGIATGLVVIVGIAFFRLMNLEVRQPIFEKNSYLSKPIALILFIVFVYFAGWLAAYTEGALQAIMSKNLFNLFIGTVALWLIFEHLCYKG
jgi:Mn2+/Fe2+ NRAMP family transporter